MLNSDIKRVIGWYNKAIDHFLCVDCFFKTKKINRKNYEPIRGNNLEEDIYTCDECGEKFELEDKIRIKKDKDGEKEVTKGCLGCGLVVLFLILVVIIIAVFSGSDNSVPNPEALYTTCNKSCKWDAGYWKYTMWPAPPEYFLTRSGCINYCEQHIKSAY